MLRARKFRFPMDAPPPNVPRDRPPPSGGGLTEGLYGGLVRRPRRATRSRTKTWPGPLRRPPMSANQRKTTRHRALALRLPRHHFSKALRLGVALGSCKNLRMRNYIATGWVLFLWLAASACSDATPSAPQAAAARPGKPHANAEAPPKVPGTGDVPVPHVTTGRTDLLFSFVDARGEVRAVSSVVEVPESVRERVLVTDLSMTPEQRQAHRYAFFVDLRAPDADGSFPVTTVSRYNAARGEGLNVILPPAEKGAVVVYSAEWCGFCKKAKRWLTEKNVPFIERDVERQPGASKELSAKLEAAGIRGGGVPVIDWGGQIIMGFDVAKMTELYQGGHAAPPAPGASAP